MNKEPFQGAARNDTERRCGQKIALRCEHLKLGGSRGNSKKTLVLTNACLFEGHVLRPGKGKIEARDPALRRACP
jgi:hypothetical protein